jgi:long-chain acyl-CoA synthetase
VNQAWTLARLARTVETALDEVGLSMPQYRLLMVLSMTLRSNPSWLASQLSVSPPSVTAVVDGLVARELVERSHDPADRRRVVHQMTAEGERLLAEAGAAVEARLVALLDHLRSESKAARALRSLGLRDEAFAEEWKAAVAAAEAEAHAKAAAAQ